MIQIDMWHGTTKWAESRIYWYWDIGTFIQLKNKVNKKILTDIIKFISILENGYSGMFGITLKLVLQGRGLNQN